MELPIGTVTVLQNPDERRSWRFRKVTILYAHRYKVKFLPSAELNLAAAAAPPSPPLPTRKKEIVKSELTISTELIVKFIRKHVEPGNGPYSSKNLATASAPPCPQFSSTFTRSPTSSVRSMKLLKSSRNRDIYLTPPNATCGLTRVVNGDGPTCTDC
jgi:hypothetical protein